MRSASPAPLMRTWNRCANHTPPLMRTWNRCANHTPLIVFLRTDSVAPFLSKKNTPGQPGVVFCRLAKAMEHPNPATGALRICVNNREACVCSASVPSTSGSVSAMERRLIRALVKEYGWRTTQQGILKPDHLGWGNL